MPLLLYPLIVGLGGWLAIELSDEVTKWAWILLAAAALYLVAKLMGVF